MRNELELFIGFTENNGVVFANINIGDYFAVSFDESEPIFIDEEKLRDKAEIYAEESDETQKIYLLEKFNCRPSELVDELYSASNVYDLFDCSLYPENYTINGKDIYFEAVGCGQNDVRDRMKELAIPETLWSEILNLWDNYHLKDIKDMTEKEQNVLFQFEKEIKRYQIDESEIIRKHLRKHINEIN